ncbi:TetR/AcrR family transcriptional regulator [Amycolatopsis sp. NBC_00348]|uniref:TetR/AcrR family transcriptional regulator n=1 Tax=Amycolatopsis sp. NBC_00348 TaxID=2975956 RepID=UPI002E25CE46
MPSDPRRIQPRKQPRQVRAELTRERILTAAAHVFAEHGYAAGTTNRIAERARISIGSLYQYFPNKDAILAELLIRHLDSGEESTGWQQRHELTGSLDEIVRALVHLVIEHHLDDPQLLRLLLEQAPRSQELLEKVGRYEQARIAFARDLFDRHPEVGVTDTATAAKLVVTTLELVVHQLVASREPVDIDRLENELVGMLTRYLRG